MKLIETPELLNCHFKNGMMILPYYHSIIEARLNQQTFAGEGVQKAPIRKRLWSLLTGLRHCKIKQKDILIFSSTLFNVKRNGIFYNCLHGYYYDLFPNDTLLIEDGDTSYIWRTKDPCRNLSFVNTYIELLCLFLQKICHTVAPIRRSDYDLFIQEYPELFNGDLLSKADYFTKFYAYFIKKLLKRVNPRVVFVNCGSYGHTRAIICYVAKQMGIKVIEPQHGVTYKCTGYVTPKFIANSEEYQGYLPDTLFTFGDYWKQFVNWKYEMVSVGYQYLNEYAAKNCEAKVTHEYLVISQPMNEEEEEKKEMFVKSLSHSFPDKRILFRIHPSENYEQQKSIYKDCSNVEVSNSTKVLYEDINRCKYIIGWFSNCLYECLAFKRVPIIVDTQYTRDFFPHNIGIWIENPKELKTKDLEAMQGTAGYSNYWATDFEHRVKSYIDNIK